VTYFSKFKNHTHSLRNATEIIVDGRVVKRPGIRATFRDHRFSTNDPRIVEIMDNEVLTQKKWASIMYKAPSAQELDRARKVAAKLAEAKKKIIEEMGDEVPQAEIGQTPKNFQEFLKRERAHLEKEKSRLIQGRRSVGNLTGRTT
jgi:hypothetical protein